MYGIESWLRHAAVARPDGPAPTMITVVCSTTVVIFELNLVSSFRRNVRGGIEEQQLEHLVALLNFVILSNSNDRWVSDLNGDGVFRVKDVRNLLDKFFLPRADVSTRWVKNIPIKVNIFAWKLALDRLPTRANLVQRNVVTESQSCPLCDAILEDTSHLFFNCSLARDVTRLLCRWWNLGVQTFSSYAEWLVWFNSVRLASNLKVILEGVFYVTWWSLWNFRNQLLFASKKPRKESIFDDIVLRSFCWCKARGDRDRYMRDYAAYEQFVALCEQEVGGSRSGPKRRRTYIPREREEAEQRLIDDYFSDDEGFEVNIRDLFVNPEPNIQQTLVERCDLHVRKTKEIRDRKMHIDLRHDLMEHLWNNH
ncbi:RNA-directed DNA polymerase, eukaryota [Tanacetum coccineum]|uniref:RNA-directed DNA polymerase, eukaryota n=1 Tax=Tanacetum coccineum TaxID=301880 RepID=A0ABQ5AE42_9ASTR